MSKISKNLNKIIKNKWLKYGFYTLLILIMTFTLLMIGKYTKVNKFVNAVELKTLDLRFELVHRYIKPNPKIVIVNIDDTSLQILENKYGLWPWKRSAYTQLINYMEGQKADSIIFDMMFIGYQHGNEALDKQLVQSIVKYPNIYVAMNFDDRDDNNEPALPSRLKVNVQNNSRKVDFSPITFNHYRSIIKEITESTPNIGIINFMRDDDGIARRSPVFVKLDNNYYPHLAFKLAYDYLKKHENLKQDNFTVDKNGCLTLGKRKIHLDKDGLMTLNWYGPEMTYEYIPFWKIEKSMIDMQSGKPPLIPQGYFKDKVVFVGVTATSLFDIKSTPLSRIYPGTEIQATAFNNILDGNSIQKIPVTINIMACVLLSLLTGLIVIRLRSTVLSSFLSITVALLYLTFATYLLKNNMWIAVVNPIIFIISTFIFMYIVKYLLKSRDYEYTYKLATTDGLTNLYNHRYFQENLLNAIEKAKKSEHQFSLILIDIDFFKKFNDTYGHQAGDIVLRKVAEILKKSVKSTDFVARYGGEEMVIILNKTNLDRALSVANRLCKAISAKPFKLADDLEVTVTISLGVSAYPLHGTTSSELIDFSDKGLYRAKLNGRNQVGEIPGYITSAIPEEETDDDDDEKTDK